MNGLVDVDITFLEMTEPPARPAGPPPHGAQLLPVETPPVHFFLYLYRTVGAAHDWTDLLAWSEADLAVIVQDPRLELHVLYRGGAPAGFFQLDRRQPQLCDLAYFGLTPEAIGVGLGGWLLRRAVEMGWRRGVERMTVNTCTLDHPAALGLYQRAGFRPYRTETRQRRVP